MNSLSQRIVQAYMALGPRYLPFADVATPDLPLHKLLRLSLFQVSVGMVMVLLVGTLNRVMIVELGVSASLVGVMLALPLVAAPFRALIGHSSDTHHSELGWRRVPFIWKGTLAQFSGFAIMPFSLLLLATRGEGAEWSSLLGQVAAGLSFLLVGAGMHTVQTAGLALATDLTPPESHPKVVGLMYVTLLLGMIVSALLFGMALADYSNGRLMQVISTCSVVTLILNGIAMWKQEPRNPPRGRRRTTRDPTFLESWAKFCEGQHTVRRLVIVGIGTLAFGLADVLLEPFGGQVLRLDVAYTTKLTALLAAGGLIGFGYASYVLNRGDDVYRVTQQGAVFGIPGFIFVLAAPGLGLLPLFLVGNFLIGFGSAIFGHATLTATMNLAPKSQAGIAIGAWGSVQATAAGLAMAFSGVIRDGVNAVFTSNDLKSVIVGYNAVYVLEIVLLAVTLWATIPLVRRRFGRSADQTNASSFTVAPSSGEA